MLVRVHAAALNPYDWHVMRGDPLVARLMGGVGLTRPKARVAGVDAAGQVEAVGANVRGLRHGDEVLGLLVNGAAGGVGTFAVQIAAALDAEVTAVCSKGNVELVRSIGAAHVIDYTTEDFTDGRARYDVILDNVCDRPLRELRRAVIPTGTLVLNGGGPPGRVVGAVGSILRVVVVNAVVRERLRLFPHKQNRENLLTLTGLIVAGKLTPVLDRTYPLADTAEGLRHVERGHARGKVVITVP